MNGQIHHGSAPLTALTAGRARGIHHVRGLATEPGLGGGRRHRARGRQAPRIAEFAPAVRPNGC